MLTDFFIFRIYKKSCTYMLDFGIIYEKMEIRNNHRPFSGNEVTVNFCGRGQFLKI